MTHTHAAVDDIDGTMKAGSVPNNNKSSHYSSENGYIIDNMKKHDVENSASLDVDQQKDYVYKMHNYCCNPEQLKKKCNENYHKLVLKRKELGSAKRKIKLLKSKIAFLKDVIKNMKQNGNEMKMENKSL